MTARGGDYQLRTAPQTYVNPPVFAVVRFQRLWGTAAPGQQPSVTVRKILLARQLFEVWEATQSPAAQTALIQIGKLYEIERKLQHLPADERAAERRRRAAPCCLQGSAGEELREVAPLAVRPARQFCTA